MLKKFRLSVSFLLSIPAPLQFHLSLFVFPPCNRSRGLNCAPFASDYCAMWPEIGGQEEGPRRRVKKTLTQVLLISAERERKKLISRGKNMHTHTPHRRENCASNKQRTENDFQSMLNWFFDSSARFCIKLSVLSVLHSLSPVVVNVELSNRGCVSHFQALAMGWLPSRVCSVAWDSRYSFHSSFHKHSTQRINTQPNALRI